VLKRSVFYLRGWLIKQFFEVCWGKSVWLSMRSGLESSDKDVLVSLLGEKSKASC